MVVTLDQIALCNNPLFSKLYKFGNKTLALTAISPDKNNTLIGVGYIKGDTTNAFIMRLDTIGKILWAKRLPLNIVGNTFFYKGSVLTDVKPTKDGGYIAVGLENYNPIIVKLSSLGDVEWLKVYVQSLSYSNNLVMSIIQTKDDGFALLSNTFSGLSIAKFKADGTSQWANGISGISAIRNGSLGVEETPDGHLWVTANSDATTKDFLFKIDGVTGNFIWQYQYASGSKTDCCNHGFTNIVKTSDGGVIAVGKWSN